MSVELSVNGILEGIDDYLRESGTRTYRSVAGLEPRASASSNLALLGDVTHAETVASVRGLSQSTRIDETKKHRVNRLLAELLQLATRARLASHDDAIEGALSTPSVESAGKRVSVREALRDGWALALPEARTQVSNATTTTLRGLESLFARRVDALTEAAPELGASSARALVEAMHRRTFEKQLVVADELLRHSDDAARDLTGFALRRLDPQLKPAGSRRFDLERALAAPWHFELLRQEDLSHAVTRTFSDLGFHPSAHGRIFIDAEPRTVPVSTLVRVEVPDQLRLVLTPTPGFHGYAGWLGAWAEAHLLAATPKTLPFIDRVIGDGARALAVRKLFESLLLDEAWLKRAVRATSPQARELARLFAWRQVMELRGDAGRLLASHALLERGAVRGFVDTATALQERVTFVQPDAGRAYLDAELLAPALTSLDAWALESHLLNTLRERFNEDWWRNPAAGRFLSDLAARGTVDDAAVIAEGLGRGPLSATDASRRRVVVMGA